MSDINFLPALSLVLSNSHSFKEQPFDHFEDNKN